MAFRYAYQGKPGTRTAKAALRGINASYKDLCEVCRNVRGKDTDYALEFLKQAAEGKRAVYFARHNSGKGHRKELGGKKGGWPVKSARLVLEVVKSAAANASKLGLGETKIAHIMANKEDIYPRLSPKGRRIRHDYETAFVEVVLEEKQADGKAALPKKDSAAKEKEPGKAEKPGKESAKISQEASLQGSKEGSEGKKVQQEANAK
ncbi:MAG: 50S ribosomal protein L22 [Candidatus Micrarchaeota archaeon]|nr:50S ribosomal protein L22 [Candidatus Micrarchaeota archaeon]